MKNAETDRKYITLDRECAEMYDRICARRKYEETPFIAREGARAEWEAACLDLSRRAHGIAEPDGVCAALKSHLIDFTDMLTRRMDKMFRDPAAAMGVFLRKFGSMDQDHREKAEQDRVLISLYGKMDGAWDGVRTWLDQADPALLYHAIGRFRRAAEAIRHEEFEGEVRRALDRAAEKLCRCADEMASLIPEETPEEERMSFEDWQDELRRVLGVDPDDLLEWGDSEYEKTREDCFSLARDAARSVGAEEPRTMEEVNMLLNRYAGPCDTPEEMFEKARGYLAKTRALAHSIVPLPDDEHCLLSPVPFSLRHSFPWGGYSDGDTEARPVSGKMFLNQYNYKALTDGWLKLNCLHEAYPGHHVQFVRSVIDPIPETMHIGARSIPIMEGSAHRTEKVYAYIYDGDVFYPLFAAYRRHHTAVRIRADLMLYRDRRPLDEAAKLYQKELGFDSGTAMGQVQAQLDMPGYFTCYYYGVRAIEKMEKESGMTRDDFTRLLFAWSTVSIDTFRKILILTDGERASAPLRVE